MTLLENFAVDQTDQAKAGDDNTCCYLSLPRDFKSPPHRFHLVPVKMLAAFIHNPGRPVNTNNAVFSKDSSYL